MLKPLTIEFQGKSLSLECTHKAKFPPPQMYGNTPEDVDKMWKQGVIDATLYQSLTVWRDVCGVFVMNENKCTSCPQALLQKPRPGRPHVIETENWLLAQRALILKKQKEDYQLPTQLPIQLSIPFETEGVVSTPMPDEVTAEIRMPNEEVPKPVKKSHKKKPAPETTEEP